MAQSDTDTAAADRADSGTAAAQSYSPLGQGAAAFTPPSPGMASRKLQLNTKSILDIDKSMDVWPDDPAIGQGATSPVRSPLRALSANSPRRRSISSFNRSITSEASLSKLVPLPSKSPVANQHSLHAQSHAHSHAQAAETHASRVSKQSHHHYSPLPPNALVAYSSDDDDGGDDDNDNFNDVGQHCVDATESKSLQHPYPVFKSLTRTAFVSPHKTTRCR